MQLSQIQVEQFQQLYRKHTGEDLTVEEANDCGQMVVELVRLVLTKHDTYEPKTN